MWGLAGPVPYTQRPVFHRGTFGFETTTDEEGFYRLCRVPEEELLNVTATYDGVETPGDTLKIMQLGGVREHTVRVRVRREPR